MEDTKLKQQNLTQLYQELLALRKMVRQAEFSLNADEPDYLAIPTIVSTTSTKKNKTTMNDRVAR